MKTKNQNGFTLVELMVVTGLLAFVIIGMMQLFIYASIQADMTGTKMTALSEAQTKLEEIRNSDFDDVFEDFTTSCPCSDGADNDADGETDYPDDPECLTQTVTTEANSAVDAGACVGTFDPTQVTGKGIIYVYTSDASIAYVGEEIIEVAIFVSWQDKTGRVIGEDTDLDGTLDAGEDDNGDGELSSPIELRTFITRR